MNSVYIQELKHYSKKDLLKLLGDDEKVFAKLANHQLITRDNDSYQLNYVGVIIIGNLVVNAYPKYFPEENKRDFKQIIRVIKKYSSLHDNLEYQNEELEDISFNLLSMMVFFMEDYYEYGVYSNVRNIIQINGTGEIDWNRTVNSTDPIIKGSKPYYVELHTRYKINNLFDYFRMLHEYIITKCSQKLEKAGLLELFDLTPVEISDKNLDDFGDLDVILNSLEKELNVEFNTHKQKLLKSMHTFLKEENSFSNENYMTLYGTSAYHVIWEEMCRKVFGDKLNKTLCNLNLEDSRTRLIDIIEKPVWYYKGIYPNEAESTFIPDIVTFHKNTFIILDAKYYNLKFAENKLKGHPGLESITKQYMYELAYHDFIEKHGFEAVRNAFLFPKYTGDIENMGNVRLKIFDELARIQVIMLPADKINHSYLNNKSIPVSDLNLDKESF